MSHKWMTHLTKVPDTPLCTTSVLNEQRTQWPEMQVCDYGSAEIAD